jgi:hypothetical protein
MLLHGCPEAATSGERRVHQHLKALLEVAAAQQAENSASRQWSECDRGAAPSAHQPNPPPSRNQDHGGGATATASVVKSRLGPNRDARDTIEAHRRAASVNNHRDGDNRTLEEGSLGYDGGLVRLRVQTNFGTTFNHQQAPFSGTIAREQVIKIQSSIAFVNIFYFSLDFFFLLHLLILIILKTKNSI